MSLIIKPAAIAQIKSVLVSEGLNDGRTIEKPVTVVPPIVDPVRKVFRAAR
jgi:predicted nucleic acid-binding protein